MAANVRHVRAPLNYTVQVGSGRRREVLGGMRPSITEAVRLSLRYARRPVVVVRTPSGGIVAWAQHGRAHEQLYLPLDNL